MSWFGQAIQSTFDGVRDGLGKIGEMVGTALNLPYTEKLNDKYLLQLLAACALDSYDFGKGGHFSKHLEEVYRQEESIQNANGLQFGVYRIKHGEHSGKKILAFRGTATLKGILQDASLINPSGPLGIVIRQTIKSAVERTKEQMPNFICGHSLGGFIAECVCSFTGIPGAAFNAPGPWAGNPLNNCANGTSYRGVKFEIHLTKKDLVSNFGSAGGPNSSHIGKPIWHDGPASVDPIQQHSMDVLYADIGLLK